MDLYCENTNLQLNRKFLRAVSNEGQRTLQTASSSLEVLGGDSRGKTQSQGSHAHAERKGGGSKQVEAVTNALISCHALSLREAGLRGRWLSSIRKGSFPFCGLLIVCSVLTPCLLSPQHSHRSTLNSAIRSRD